MFVKINNINEFSKYFGEYISDKDYRIYCYTNKQDTVWYNIIGFELYYYRIVYENDTKYINLTVDTIYDNPEIYVIDFTDTLFDISVKTDLLEDIKLYLSCINDNEPFVQDCNIEVLKDL